MTENEAFSEAGEGDALEELRRIRAQKDQEREAALTGEGTPPVAVAEAPKQAKPKGKAKKASESVATTTAKETKKKAAPAPAEAPAPVPAASTDKETGETVALTKEQLALQETARAALTEALEQATPGEPILLLPEHCLIHGLDCPDDASDPLSAPDRVAIPLDEQWIGVMDSVGSLPGGEVVLIVRDGVPWVQNGRQRSKNLRETNKRRVKRGDAPIKTRAVIARDQDADEQAMAVGILDYYRIDDTPMAKARRAARYMARFNNKATVAEIMHCSEQNVRFYLSIVGAPEKVQKLIEAEDKAPGTGLTLTAAVHLLKIPDREQQVEVAKQLLEDSDGRPVAVRDVKAAVKAAMGEEGEDEDGEKPRARTKPGAKGWQAGTQPKKRFVTKVIERMLQSAGDEGVTDEEDLISRVVGWILEGNPPPKILSGHVRAVNNEGED